MNTQTINKKMTIQEERNWAVALHLSVFGNFVFPFGGLIMAIVIWMLKKDESQLIQQQAKEVFNFMITLFLAGIALLPLVFLYVGIPLSLALCVYYFVMCIIAAIKTHEGKPWMYPYKLNLIK